MSQRLALYVHWPYCQSKCPYCDFNSHVRKDVPEERWRDALISSLRAEASALQESRLSSIFFGGGTPSLMSPQTVAAVINTAQELWPPAADLEVTLEANPASSLSATFAGYRAAGVNRLSLGIQALDDRRLAALGRTHNTQTALKALEAALATFARVSADLIYAVPGQSAEAWRKELRQLLSWPLHHLSLYQLTVEPGTAFAARAAVGALILPDEELAVELYQISAQETQAANLHAYEVSNYARQGEECRHNLHVWRAQPYLGLGPGAHGRLLHAGQWTATTALRSPERWLARVERQGGGWESSRALSWAERRDELVFMGLRLEEGIDFARAAQSLGLAGLSPKTLCAALVDCAALTQLSAAGYLKVGAHNLRLTAQGRQCLNAVITRLLCTAPSHPPESHPPELACEPPYQSKEPSFSRTQKPLMEEA